MQYQGFKMPSLHLVFLFFFLLQCSDGLPQDAPQAKYRNGIKVGFFSFMAGPFEISRDYQNREQADFVSRPSLSFHGTAACSRLIGNRIELSAGLLVGVYPMRFDVRLDSTFSTLEKDYSNWPRVDRSTAIYGGLSLGVKYMHPISGKQKISLGIACDYVFFIPQFYNYRITYLIGQQRYPLFKSSANMNIPEKGFISPVVSIGYYHAVGRRFVPYLLLSKAYSNNSPIVGKQFVIFGKDEDHTGTFKMRYQHIGAELGCQFQF